jgi:hypothetical protein
MRATYAALLILDSNILFGEVYKLWSLDPCHFSLLGPDIPLSPLFSEILDLYSYINMRY